MPTRKSRVDRKKRKSTLSRQEKQLAQTNSALMAPTGVLLILGASALLGNSKSKGKKKIPKIKSKKYQKNFNKLREQSGRPESSNTYYETISELGGKTKKVISRTLSKVVEGQKLKQLYNPGDGVYGATVVRARFAKGKKKSIKKKSKRSKK